MAVEYDPNKNKANIKAAAKKRRPSDASIRKQIASNSDAAPDMSGRIAKGKVRFPKGWIDVKRIREKTGLTQKAFAAKYQLPLATLRKWEQNQRQPTGAARLLLIMIDTQPKAVAKALEAA